MVTAVHFPDEPPSGASVMKVEPGFNFASCGWCKGVAGVVGGTQEELLKACGAGL
jgi:hypothetical protein